MGPTKLIGKVFVMQMTFEDEDRWLLKRISPMCTNCNKNKFYYIYKDYDFDPNFKLFIVGSNYAIVCPVCGERIELDFQEFLSLKLFISVNKKLEKGKISDTEYRNETKKIWNKLKKTL
jgi:hypothetical protein